MSAYTCTDCGEPLEGRVRKIELEEGETAHITDSGELIATIVACSNGCDDEKKAQSKRKKRAPAAAEESERPCARSLDCSKPFGHTGMCNKKKKGWVDAT